MSNIIEEGPRYLPNTSSEKKHILSKVQVKNEFTTGEPHRTTDELHLTQNYIQEKKMYLSISKRNVRIRLQSLHNFSSFPLTVFTRFPNIRFHYMCVKMFFLKILTGGQ